MRKYLSGARQILASVLDSLSERLEEAIDLTRTAQPGSRQKLFRWLWIHLDRLVTFLRKGWYVDLVLLEGCAQESGMPMRVACLAPEHIFGYFQKILFEDGGASTQHMGRIKFWQIPAVLKQLAPQVDLVILERSRLLSGWKPSTGQWITTPQRVNMVIEFDPGETWEQRKAKMSKLQRKRLRRLAREGFTFSVRSEEQDFEFFYHHMYVPTVQSRHRHFLVIDPIERARRIFEQGMLVFVLDADGQPVAGDLNLVKGNTLFAVLSGVLDADTSWMARGALSALYQFEFQWCLEQGLRRFDSGGCFPLERDGVYAHKHHWGFEPVPDENFEWLVWVPQASKPALHWLQANPIVPNYVVYRGTAFEQIYNQLKNMIDS